MSAPPNNLGTELWFANVADANDGFTNLHANRELDGKDARVYRELLQNAMDASLGNGGSKCEVDVVLLTVPKSDIPHIGTYEQAFKKAKSLKESSEPQSGKQVIQRIDKALSRERVRCLVCVDNGKGIGEKELGSLYGSGASTKQATGRGSVGHGHFAAFSVSDLRYVLYAGKTEPKSQQSLLTNTFGGQALLATHTEGHGEHTQQKSSRGFIRVAGNQPRLFLDVQGGSRIPLFINKLMNSGTGAATVIVAHSTLTKPNDVTITTPDVVAATAVREFMVAVYDGALALTTYDKDSSTTKVTVGHHPGRSPEMLSCMSDRLDKHPLRRHKDDGKRRLKVLTNGKLLPDADIAARLGLGVRVWMRATLYSDDTKTTKVSIFRDGMLIEDNPYRLKPANFADRKPFHAVVDLQDCGDGSFARLVREAEGTTHSKITEREIIDKSHRAALKEKLEALREVLRSEANNDTAIDDYIPPELALFMGASVPKPKRPVVPHEIEREDNADDHDSHQADSNGETEDEGGAGDGSSPNNGANKATNPSPTQKAPKPGNSKDITSVCFRDANDPTTFDIHWELKPGAKQGGNVEVRLCLPVGTDLTSLQPGSYTNLPISTNKNHDGSDATDPVIVPLNSKTVQVWLKRPHDLDDLDVGLVRADVVRRSAATQQESADGA